MVVTYLSNTSSEKPGSIRLTGLEVAKLLTDKKGLQQGAMIGGYTLW
jgi:hypothetical protein